MGLAFHGPSLSESRAKWALALGRAPVRERGGGDDCMQSVGYIAEAFPLNTFRRMRYLSRGSDPSHPLVTEISPAPETLRREATGSPYAD